MFTKIGKILPESMEKRGFAPKLAKARAISLFEEGVQSLLPDLDPRAYRALRHEDGALIVACRTMAAATALRAVEVALRDGLSDAGVERIRFLLAPWR